ncbi:hypothetical protein ABN034_27500 [Actinopolymorpha sp. B11F2]|uniref:hypothetical protein n=1 Tax=Actinopolymorpha sp. B11F2 TaxID=3160862 RepID=UPI0032E4CCED
MSRAGGPRACVVRWVRRTLHTLPAGWGTRTIWQYTSSPLDQNYFNGAYDRLQALANG